MRRITACSLLLPCVLLFACGTGTAESSSGSAWADRSPTGHMALEYAKEFSVDYYGKDALITIAGKDQYLLVPEGETPPAGVDDSITGIKIIAFAVFLETNRNDFFHSVPRFCIG